MINHLITIKLNGVHKAEQKTLKKYLEYNCWDWKEVSEEQSRSRSKDELQRTDDTQEDGSGKDSDA